MGTCSVENCNGKVVARGLCSRHYKQLRRYGKVTITETLIRSDHCLVDGCEGEVYARGYCEPHYKRFNRTGTPVKGRKVCLVDGCGKLADIGSDYCSEHKEDLGKLSTN